MNRIQRLTALIGGVVQELGSTPVGFLYAITESQCNDRTEFDAIVGALSDAGYVRRAGQVLHWMTGDSNNGNTIKEG